VTCEASLTQGIPALVLGPRQPKNQELKNPKTHFRRPAAGRLPGSPAGPSAVGRLGQTQI
jgi:hypothetical protein